MGKRGPKPKGKVKIKWSENFAYAIGLLTTDGNLSPDNRHIAFVSKEIEQINNFMKCFNLDVKIGKAISGYDGNLSHKVQFGDVLLYRFLESIGLYAKKSKTIGKVLMPPKYFFDFLRGCFDGDGTFYSYWDKRWRSSFMFYLEFISASKKHIDWLREELKCRLNIYGHITKDGKGSTFQLKYAKKEALEIIKRMYYDKKVMCLSRKRLKIEKALKINYKQQQTYY
ncbi:MAG: hypothetical protein WC735_03305 [Candidatus Paceibacterota bacterium]|jgi:hypothetical protein